MQVNYNDMEKNISFFGYQSIIFNLVKSCSLGLSTYIMFSISKVDSYIAALLGVFFGIIPFLIITYITNNKNEEDIIDLNNRLFGKVIGNILNFILNISFLVLSAVVLFNVSQFIETEYIPDTSPIYVKLLILLAVVYTASKGLSTIVKVNQFIMFINLGMFIISMAGLTEKIDLYNVLPVLENGISPVLKSSVFYALSTVLPLAVMTIIPKKNISKEKYSLKSILLFYILSSLIVVLVIFTTTAIQGYDLLSIYRFPEYVVLREFSMFTIIERIEKTLSLQFLFNVIMFMIFAFYFIIESIKKFMKNNKDKSYLSWIIGVICLFIASNLFSNELILNSFIRKYLFVLLVVGILVPVIITFIGVVIENIKLKKKNKNDMS